MAEVVPDDGGTSALMTVTGMESSMDGDTGVLSNSSLSELIAAGLVKEGLNLQSSSESVLPAVDEVLWKSQIASQIKWNRRQ